MSCRFTSSIAGGGNLAFVGVGNKSSLPSKIEIEDVSFSNVNKGGKSFAASTGETNPGDIPGELNNNPLAALNVLNDTELAALRGAGLSDIEIGRQIELLGDIILFRGTTEGFPGHPALQRLGISPASTDPLVATVFALEGKAKGGNAVILFGTKQQLGNPAVDLGNVRRILEREVGVGLTPSDFARNAPNSVPVDKARQILSELGIADLPPSIQSTDEATRILKNTPRLSPEQILEFVRLSSN